MCTILTSSDVSQLLTNYSGFSAIPRIATNSSPVIVIADFYSSLIFSKSISQTNSSSDAGNVDFFLKHCDNQTLSNITVNQSKSGTKVNINTLPKHSMPATVESLQGFVVEVVVGLNVEQSVSDVSLPLQLMFWITIGLSPEPKLEPLRAWPPDIQNKVK